MSKRRSQRLIVGLAFGVVAVAIPLYCETVVSHAHAQHSADVAAQEWQRRIFMSDLAGKTPEQVVAALHREGVVFSDYAGGSATGFLFSTLGPVSKSVDLARPSQRIMSYYVGTTFRFDGQRHLVTDFTYTLSRSDRTGIS